jgi:catechol 2,3-dioxygenase-like lactoylglutathione lyase family enzyme
MPEITSPRLKGVHHTARPTWKLKETVAFYRDVLGLKLIHCLVAKGWPEGHPDFLHFFFDSGNGSTIAFFYYLGTERPPELVPKDTPMHTATHTAWNCGSAEELAAWQKHLEAKDWPVRYRIRHEVVESIYMVDPNGYMVEIGFPTRPFVTLDGDDATISMQAAIELDEQFKSEGKKLETVASIWQRKGQLIQQRVKETV